MSNLNEQQLQRLFSCRNSITEDERRFAFLPADQVNAILDKLSDYQMHLLSDEHLKQLNVSNLSEQQLQLLYFQAAQKKLFVVRDVKATIIVILRLI